jgi:hypothetical protein
VCARVGASPEDSQEQKNKIRSPEPNTLTCEALSKFLYNIRERELTLPFDFGLGLEEQEWWLGGWVGGGGGLGPNASHSQSSITIFERGNLLSPLILV